MSRALVLGLLVACGPATQDTTLDTAGDENETADTDDGPALSTVGPGECADRAPTECTADADCVRMPGGTCRKAANECELIELDIATPQPAFDRGDPCERQNPACAWSTTTGRCAPFVPVPSCHASAEEAGSLTVLCDHSEQPALSCSYPGTQCACRRTPYCGGAAPSPDRAHPPAHFSCVPDFADNGCPNREPPANARCDLDPSVQCQLGCYGLYTCENGRWNRRQLPPRP